MVWRVGQTVLGSLFSDTDKLHNASSRFDNLQYELIKAYNIGIRRGLTPRDALAVAAAFGNDSRRSLWEPALAQRAKAARS